jgi:hypothetical protein
MSHTKKDFNPSKSVVVDNIKEATDNLIDYIIDNVPDNEDKTEAIKNYKQASMWAVRANFN